MVLGALYYKYKYLQNNTRPKRKENYICKIMKNMKSSTYHSADLRFDQGQCVICLEDFLDKDKINVINE